MVRAEAVGGALGWRISVTRTATGARRVPWGMRSTPWLLAAIWLAGAAVVIGLAASRLIEDFGRSDGVSPLGTRWMGFTDRVMGGVSDQQVTLEDIRNAGDIIELGLGLIVYDALDVDQFSVHDSPGDGPFHKGIPLRLPVGPR